jgi:Flp pilus assembly protein TadG
MIAVARMLRQAHLSRLSRDRRGMAMVEFALSLPFVVTVAMSGAELTNYVTTKMRISQVAQHIADNASRIGTGTVLSNKTISEYQINDLLVGAGIQAAKTNLFTNGRVILSSLEPMANPNTSDRYRIRWQRCKGSKTWPSSYGNAGQTNMTGISVNGQTLKAPDDGAVMFVEIAYDYKPLISTAFVPKAMIREVAAMTVRDQRDYIGGTNGIYNTENVVASTC